MTIIRTALIYSDLKDVNKTKGDFGVGELELLKQLVAE